MKYSIILPYYKRPEILSPLLTSFVQWYEKRTDYEAVFILDLKNNSADRDMFFQNLEPFWNKIRLMVVDNDLYTYNSCRAYNVGVKNCTGEFVVLTSPECKHKTNILSGLDECFAMNRNSYVVCACESINPDGSFVQWYQHTQHNNRLLHFCSAISKFNYITTVKGFDEDYIYGIAYEDDEWLARVKTSNIPLIARDDLLVSHIEHPRAYLTETLVDINRQLYIKKRK